MLRAKRDLDALQRSGRSRHHRWCSVRGRANGLASDRFAISTGRAIGSAVVRNRVRRRVREILRAWTHPAGDGWDILVICRPASAEAGYAELREGLVRLLDTSTARGSDRG
jgi:ribonuclease P protein component